jgi:hypothetical protein
MMGAYATTGSVPCQPNTHAPIEELGKIDFESRSPVRHTEKVKYRSTKDAIETPRAVDSRRLLLHKSTIVPNTEMVKKRQIEKVEEDKIKRQEISAKNRKINLIDLHEDTDSEDTDGETHTVETREKVIEERKNDWDIVGTKGKRIPEEPVDSEESRDTTDLSNRPKVNLNKPKYATIFELQTPHIFEERRKIFQEIAKYKPGIHVVSAFLNKNKDLVVYTDTKKDDNEIKKKWPDVAFGGMKMRTRERRNLAAIKGVIKKA